MASVGSLHPQVDVDYNMERKKRVNTGEYRPSINDQVLKPMDIISKVWPGPPLHRHLHVFIGLPTPGSGEYFIRPLFCCSECLMSAFPLMPSSELQRGSVCLPLRIQKSHPSNRSEQTTSTNSPVECRPRSGSHWNSRKFKITQPFACSATVHGRLPLHRSRFYTPSSGSL